MGYGGKWGDLEPKIEKMVTLPRTEAGADARIISSLVLTLRLPYAC